MVDGVNYEIDLGQPYRTRLATALAPFIAVGRRANHGPCGPQPGRLA